MNDVLGLVVTFEPSDGLSANLRILLEQVPSVLVVDNGSGAETRLMLKQEAERHPSVEVLCNESNLGVAAALNQGFQWALEHGWQQVVTFDQDSQPGPGMVRGLMEAYASHPQRERIAVFAPNVDDPHADIHALYLRRRGVFSFERVPCAGGILDDVAIVITSGSLHNLDAYQTLGGFREDFFIDYVDTEYCLRAQANGYKIAVTCNAILHHRLGDQQKKQIGSLTLRPTFHSPLRWYYINRNRIAMLGMYAFNAPYWAVYDVMVGSYAFLKMLMYEDQKLKKILAVAMGIFDGLFRRMGAIAPSRRRWLVQ
jgi:rhamnosyltransferase